MAEAKALVEQLRSGNSFDAVATSKGYEMQVELGVNRRNPTLPSELLQRVFELPPPASDSSTIEFVTTQNGDVAIVELLRVNAGDYKTLPEIERKQLQQLLSGELGNLTNSEFQRGLLEQADVKVL